MTDRAAETNQEQDAPPAGSNAEAGTATQAPAKKSRPAPPKVDKLPPYRVVLHNDDVNTMDHVVKTIVQLTPLSLDAAIRRMIEAHSQKRAMLLTTHKERAELYRDQFKSRQLTVTIEAAV